MQQGLCLFSPVRVILANDEKSGTNKPANTPTGEYLMVHKKRGRNNRLRGPTRPLSERMSELKRKLEIAELQTEIAKMNRRRKSLQNR